MSKEPRNEQAVCAVVALLEQRIGEPLTVTSRPDTLERQRPAVELLCETATRKFAVEHTRIESFPTQIADGEIFSSLLEPLEAELAGTLPGHFWLVVAVGATAGVRAETASRHPLAHQELDARESSAARGAGESATAMAAAFAQGANRRSALRGDASANRDVG
jgi:hypothetical protein